MLGFGSNAELLQREDVTVTHVSWKLTAIKYLIFDYYFSVQIFTYVF